MWSWAPLAAAVFSAAVSLLLAFGSYVGRRSDTDGSLSTHLAVDAASIEYNRRQAERDITRIEADLANLRSRLHELADRQVGEVIVRLAVLERDVRRLDERVSELVRAVAEGT